VYAVYAAGIEYAPSQTARALVAMALFCPAVAACAEKDRPYDA
jgi:hypothetical protein